MESNFDFMEKTLDEWVSKYPILREMMNFEEVFWKNSRKKEFSKIVDDLALKFEDVLDAEKRLLRFSKYIEKAYPETGGNKGIIESDIVCIGNMKKELDKKYGREVKGKLYAKLDCNLPISGSIKARGGIYEVLKFAEKLAFEKNLLSIDDDYSILDTYEFSKFFSKYTIIVGSTGNLGLSIGIISAKLGFKVEIHMSSDAKQWKKDLLKSKGAIVVEYEKDYSYAVKEARKKASLGKMNYFIDDENSKDLFLGYSVSALRLKEQLEDRNIVVDNENQLAVYLPCGVGGGPGGVAFGLKLIYGDNVKCYFAEPVNAACMTLGLLTGLNDKVSTQDFNIDKKTEADGLAVSRASGFVGDLLKETIDGSYTIKDEELSKLLKMMYVSENIKIEPSSAAGFKGMYMDDNDLNKVSHHIAWITGGSMVPQEEFDVMLLKNKGSI